MMTPQERQLIDELFDRLASLESAARDPDAVDAINAGLDRAPNALYPLVQTVLVQDEALRRADTRIRELEDRLDDAQEPPEQKSFLAGMRETVSSRRQQQGSVPSVRSGETSADAPPESKWGSGTTLSRTRASPLQGGYPEAREPAQSGGGSFLGTAAATAAGVVGGALLMNSFRGMFGGQQSGQQGQSALGQGGSPWDQGSGAGDLARQAGAEDIGRSGDRTAAYDAGESQRQSAFDVAQNDPQHDSDLDGDDDFGGDFDLGGGDTA
jgi:hypothetical protein